MKIPAGLHPLRHRRFRRLATAKTLSTFGSELSLVAIPFAVLGTSSWPDALGIVLMARTLPGVILMLLGGVWADRLSRARLMVSSDVASMVVQALLAVALLTHHSPLWLIAVLQALLGAAGAFFTPAAVGMSRQTERSASRGTSRACSVRRWRVSSWSPPDQAGPCLWTR
jgi:MFS family permease